MSFFKIKCIAKLKHFNFKCLRQYHSLI